MMTRLFIYAFNETKNLQIDQGENKNFLHKSSTVFNFVAIDIVAFVVVNVYW